MNFTREPIIETIVSAKEGYKLAIRSSKSGREEEYLVDAVEVVSFGGTFFYRCQEKPKPFFIPANDFEILEVKETRLLIKSPNMEKTIKIAGGKEPGSHSNKSVKAQAPPSERKEDEMSATTGEAAAAPQKQEQRREKKKYRKSKRGQGLPEENKNVPGEEGKREESTVALPSIFSHLLKPPENLISESLHRYKKTDDIISVELSADIYPVKDVMDGVKEPILVNDGLFDAPAHETFEVEKHSTSGIKADLENNLVSESAKTDEGFEEKDQDKKNETILSVPLLHEVEGFPEIPLE